jgi:hypothetical protein
MKIRMLLLTIPVFFLPLAHAGETVGVNAVVEKSAEFSDREILLTGLVDRVSAARRMVILIDTSEATCTEACDRKTVIVQLPEVAEIPAKGSFVTATGTLTPGSNPLKLTATGIVVEKR